MAGDQQAALFGQACFAPGMAKSTYGTGCFMLVNTGGKAVTSRHRLLTTPAYRLDGETTYALEGSIFVAGAAVKWLRDGLGVIADAAETDSAGDAASPTVMASTWSRPSSASARLIGTPTRAARFSASPWAHRARIWPARRWRRSPTRRSILPRRWRGDGAAHAVGAPRSTAAWPPTPGCASSSPTSSRFAVERPRNLETTALGAAFLAGLATGVWDGLDALADIWKRRDVFTPAMGADHRSQLIAGWREAVARTLSAGA